VPPPRRFASDAALQADRLLSCQFDQLTAVSLFPLSTADAIGPGHLFDQRHHMLWQSVRLACQGDTQPITYFLADGDPAKAVDLKIISNGWTDHKSFPVCLAAVSPDKARLKFRAITVQTRATKVGPGLLCTVLIDDMNIKSVALLEDGRLSSFDLWGKSGEYEQGGCDEARNCDG
jgi:hypothetical protein